MPSLFSYCIPVDDGAAPNPYWGICTLVICKPRIRLAADIGDLGCWNRVDQLPYRRCQRPSRLCYDGHAEDEHERLRRFSLPKSFLRRSPTGKIEISAEDLEMASMIFLSSHPSKEEVYTKKVTFPQT